MVAQNQEKKELDIKSIEAILKSGTPDQFFIIEKWSRVVGKVLSNIEIALSEGRQYTILKRLLNDIMYGARNNLLSYLANDIDDETIKVKIHEETDRMMAAIDNKVEMSFPQVNQQRAIKSSIHGAVEEILLDIFAYFSTNKN